jgi:AcrR family transcriptional regulator
MGRRRRLKGEERRESILKAARQVFAEHGFRGTTTRALAEAAGVSEALLFQHFPSKEALYAAMLATITQERDVSPFRELMALEPSTAALVRIVHAFYSALIEKQDEMAEDHKATLTRLMFRSMTEDGEFARSYLRQVPSHLARRIAQCIQAAIDAGEAVDTPISPDLAGWLTHHLAVMLMLNHLATPPNLDYGMPRAALVRQAVLFALRGIGIKEKVIQRCYHPEEWVKARR